MAAHELASHFAQRVHARIDFACKGFLCRAKGRDNVGESGIAGDEQIQVTSGGRLPGYEGTINEGGGDVTAERLQGRTDDFHDSGGFHHELSQFREDRTAPIRLIIDLPAAQAANDDTGAGEALELALEAAEAGLRRSGDLAEIITFVGVSEEHSQDCAARLAEQHRT